MGKGIVMSRQWSKATIIERQPGSTWVNLEPVIKCAENMDEKKGLKVVDEVLSIVGQWGLKGKLDTLIVVGWLLAQIVQSIWDWRPHLRVTGPQGSGKTLLTLFFEMIGGGLARRFEGAGSSEAGIRQEIGNNSVLTIIDEFESNEHRKNVEERIMRSASRGGMQSKGAPNQQNVIYRTYHMFLVAAIEQTLKRAADNYRSLIVETVKDATRAPKLPGPDQLEELRIKVFAYAIWAGLKAKALISQVAPVAGVDSRFVQSLAVPFSMVAVSDDSPADTLNKLIAEYLEEWTSSQQADFLEDEAKLLETIMLASIRLPMSNEDGPGEADRIVYVIRTVTQLIEQAKINKEVQETLQAYGVKYRTDGVFMHPDKVRRSLLSNTDWSSMSLRDILSRLPGAVRIRDRIAGSQVRGVFLPNESLTDYLEPENCHDVTGPSQVMPQV